ncbi:carbamoyl phosphate synthase small subunit [Tenuibacillus multivorans]|uniref:Carbamoyl phosphate synthase small chain n=1 Tax=Tenuibacillus multivorans TaxID=237069 RepID=A0A1G9Y460_9BACI|nr:carbamoyl phosphate synthase small subunit [Tenuibacillus multivorans]GEL75944.1 carbamoyl-phosphate synthase pyrimidine-specific small chain [Tenuibacillus multivorans]SDN03902.1 carbamoyl-phosphate synthase small subunit [Tenuibacillus multivorans]
MSKRYLILEDGSVFKGTAFGASVNNRVGEVVFNTSMTGYQEIISDPSYCDQMVTMTYPLIGNYGINRDDFETIQPAISALIVKEYTEFPSNFRHEWTLDEYLSQKNIPGLANIDTRRLVKRIRQEGSMKAMLTDSLEENDEVFKSLQRYQPRTDQVKRVSTLKPYVVPGHDERIVLVDFGMKHGILREFTKRNCHVTVVPYHMSAEDILQLKPDGVMLSNGPGNPKDVPEGIALVKNLMGKVPIFGICLGHQLIALACGADTHKMKFGHRGANHPVKQLHSGEVWMTSQNHGYAVTASSLAQTSLTMTQVALNDETVEGLEHESYHVFSVQYHPESSPGPEDSNRLFDEFLNRIGSYQEGRVVHA